MGVERMTRELYPALPVLLVDDEAAILRSYRIVLLRAGITNVVCCDDSREVLGLLKKHNASLVLMDLTMPHLTGEELLEQIVESFPDVPVIVITGNTDVDSATICMELGACDYIVKPLSKERLFQAVEENVKMGA